MTDDQCGNAIAVSVGCISLMFRRETRLSLHLRTTDTRLQFSSEERRERILQHLKYELCNIRFYIMLLRLLSFSCVTHNSD